MTLSNIFIEPRREITESVIGIGFSTVPLSIFGWATYSVALTMKADVSFSKLFLAAIIVAVAFIIIIGVVAGFFAVTHAIGSGLCNALEKRSIQLRPKERYRRNSRGAIERVN